MTVNRILRLIAEISLTIFFIWLVAKQINIEELRKTFSETNRAWVIGALSALFIGYACRIERWCVMLKNNNTSINWYRCAGPLLGSFAANNTLPCRFGDVLRAFAFNDRLGVSSSVVVATLLVERLLDLLMVLVFLGVTLTLFCIDVNDLVGYGIALLFFIAMGILFLLLYPQFFARVAITLSKFVARIAVKHEKKIIEEINKSLATLEQLAKGNTMIRLLAWTLVVWLAEGCVFWFAALALSSIETPASGWLALPIGTLATLIPSTPGYVGTFDYLTIHAMISLGNNLIASTAYALLVHALLWLPTTLIGGLYLVLHPIKKNPKVN
jgi:uncharacterized protein (TIRG00374 family)